MFPRSFALPCAVTAVIFALPVYARTVTFDLSIGDGAEVQAVSAPVRAGESFSFGTSITQSTTPVDIIFLSDVTGSMGSITNAAEREADDIIARTATLAGDVAWTVASYRDFPTAPWGDPTDRPFILDQAVTEDPELAANGLRAWESRGGSDGKESGLFALNEIATGQQSYREASDRYVLWFGDQPSHDPDDTPGYPRPTLDQTLTSLLAADITVLGVDVGNLNGNGELNRLVSATGGSIGTLTGGLSDLVFNSLFEAIDPRTNLTLGFTLTGADGASSFVFERTFDELTRGSYTVTVDTDTLTSSIVARDLAFNPDPNLAPIPLPASLPMLGAGLGLLAWSGRRARRGSQHHNV